MKTLYAVHFDCGTMGTYSKLSAFMARYPEIAIFRTFADLNVKNILYYEAELAHLERELQEVEKRDAACGTSPRQNYGTRWIKMQAGLEWPEICQEPRQNTQGDERQWRMIVQIRKVLEKYSGSIESKCEKEHN
jgi:hypothetical protein